MFKRQLDKQKNIFALKGFTVVEILVVIAIMLIMLSVALVSMRSASDNAKVKSAQREVASAIRLAQSDALQGKTMPSVGLPQCYVFKFTSATAYGIYYNNTDACPAANDQASPIESYTLNSGVKLTSPSLYANTRITFSVPHGEASNARTFVISNSSKSLSKNVYVKTGGSVTEDN
jgi:prepilin-type N-terminal cleavage/methylation domain-containing protein